ncbi:MAG: 50S ribosomal protein L33 [Alphaproteobacteria bacterium]|jgi:ribosomal protein L33|nr:50S ribosomal protein L33 [Alphaproteobacteria bacterium]
MAKKGNAIHIKLRNPETGTFYITKKNPKSERTTEKLKFKKYDKKTQKHETFVEAKV